MPKKNPDLIVEQWPIGRLTGYLGNPRKNDHVVDRMCQTITEFGFRIPVVATSDGQIVDGHLRHKAALKMGMKTIPVALADELTPQQIKAFRIAANASAAWADWDTDLLRIELTDLKLEGYDLNLTGFDDVQLVQFMAGVPTGADPEATPEPPSNPVSRKGDLWLLGNHRLMCGDATVTDDVKMLMDGKKADCVFTSPPYGVGIDYGEYQDTIDNLRSMLPKLAEVWMKAVRPGGFAVVNFGDIISGREAAQTEDPCEYPMAVEYWPIFRKAGWKLWSRRIWTKRHASVHSPWAIQSSRASSDWEHIWTWKSDGAPIAGRGEFSAFGVWGTDDEKTLELGKDVHGAGMVASIAHRGIVTHSTARGIVLEPFSGTGTTTIASEMSSRACYAMELEPQSCDITVLRWQEFSGKDARHVITGLTYEQEQSERTKLPGKRKRAQRAAGRV